ncbi:MAG: PAS domain S-box protein [Thermoanaerobaculia bacterium]
MTESMFVNDPVNVLLLEDSDVDAHLLDAVLRRFGFVVERVSRLTEALALLRSESFDLILSDLGLPDSSGLATLDALLQQRNAIPIVVITGRDDEATALRAVAAGAQDYLVKGSTDANALVRAVRYAVERGKASEEISRSEARLRTLLEGALDAVVTIRGDGRIVRWNRSAEEIFGWPRPEALGELMHELIVPERFRDQHRRGVEQFLANANVPLLGRRFEWTALRRDGTEFPVEVRMSAETDGSETMLTAFVADITERRRAEEARRAADAKFRALIEHASDAVFLFDEDRRFSYASPAVLRMLGYEPAELAGRQLMEFIHPDDLGYVRERFEPPHAQSSLPLLAEFRFRHRSGSWRYLEMLRSNHLDNPDVRAIIANVRDVTGRRETQQALDELRRRDELILNSICDGVHGIDLAGNIVFENPAAAKMLGWRAAELIGRPAHTTIHYARADGTPRSERDCPMHWTLADGSVRSSTDDVFWRKDGTPIRVEYVSAPMLDEQGRIAGAVVTFRDMTRQRHMEQQIEQASRVASLGRVSASVAHEFNNLLMGMWPFAEILRSRSAGDESLAKPIQHIFNVIRRGQRLTDEILRFTRPPEPVVGPIDAASWLPAVAHEARGLLDGRMLDVELPDELHLHADADQLSQVMLNLITNARDATLPGDTIVIGAARASEIPFLQQQLGGCERMAALYVRDTGCGIPPQSLEQIFEPLFTTKKTGNGLGLAVAFQIMKQHEGQILIDTEVGVGSTFYLVLPVSAGAPASRAG